MKLIAPVGFEYKITKSRKYGLPNFDSYVAKNDDIGKEVLEKRNPRSIFMNFDMYIEMLFQVIYCLKEILNYFVLTLEVEILPYY